MNRSLLLHSLRPSAFLACAAGLVLSSFAATANREGNEEKASNALEEFTASEKAKFDWRVVDDGVMGGLSKGNLSHSKNGTVVFKGILSLENNGGFSSIRTARFKPMDLSEAGGLIIRAKGDGRTYQLRLESDARFRQNWAVSFKADFATKKGEWVEVKVPFRDFKGGWRGRNLPDKTLNPAKIERVGLILADKNPGSFQLEVDWIRTYQK